jgi:ribosomal protein S18 acetylase RimI-like enzyme
MRSWMIGSCACCHACKCVCGTRCHAALGVRGAGVQPWHRAKRVLLEVRASNAKAIAMYEHRLGFASVGRRRGYYADGEDALLMALALPER